MNSWLFLDIAPLSPFTGLSPESEGADGSGLTGLSFEAVLASLLGQQSESAGDVGIITPSAMPVTVTRTGAPDSVPQPDSIDTQLVPANLVIRNMDGQLLTIPVTAKIDSDDGAIEALTITMSHEYTAAADIEQFIAEFHESDKAIVFSEDVWELLPEEWQDAVDTTSAHIVGAVSLATQNDSIPPAPQPSSEGFADSIQPAVATSHSPEIEPSRSDVTPLPASSDPAPEIPVSAPETDVRTSSAPVKSDTQQHSPDRAIKQSGPEYDILTSNAPDRQDTISSHFSDDRPANTYRSEVPRQTSSVPMEPQIEPATVKLSHSAPAGSTPSEQAVPVTSDVPVVTAVSPTEPAKPSPSIRIPSVPVYLTAHDTDGTNPSQPVHRLPHPLTIHVVVDENVADQQTPRVSAEPAGGGGETVIPVEQQVHQDSVRPLDSTELTVRHDTGSTNAAPVRRISLSDTESLLSGRIVSPEVLHQSSSESGTSVQSGKRIESARHAPSAPAPSAAAPDATMPVDDAVPVKASPPSSGTFDIPDHTGQPLQQPDTPQVRQSSSSPQTAPSEPAPQDHLPTGAADVVYSAESIVRESDESVRLIHDTPVPQPEPPVQETRIEYYQRPVRTLDPVARQVVADHAATVNGNRTQPVRVENPLHVTSTPTASGLPVQSREPDPNVATAEHHVAPVDMRSSTAVQEPVPMNTLSEPPQSGQTHQLSVPATPRTVPIPGETIRSTGPSTAPLQQPVVTEETTAFSATAATSASGGESASLEPDSVHTPIVVPAAPDQTQTGSRRRTDQGSRPVPTTPRMSESSPVLETAAPAAGSPAGIVVEPEPSTGDMFSDDESFAPHVGADGQTAELTGDFSTPFSSAMQESETTLSDTKTVSGRQVSASRSVHANPAEITGTIVRHAVVMVKNGTSSAEIRLDPPSLGKLKLDIVTENGKITGRITVETTEVRDLMQQNLTQLRESMAQSGLKVESFDVQVGHNGGTDSWARKETVQQLMRTGRSAGRIQEGQMAAADPALQDRQTVSMHTQLFDRWI